MRLKRFTFKLKPETTLGQIWESIREWIEESPYSRFKGRKALPTKIAEGDFGWEADGDRVRLNRLAEAMRVSSERTRRGLGWRTDLAFVRGTKAVKGVVEMHIAGSVPEGEGDVREPKIVRRLCKTYGLVEERIERRNVGEGKPRVKRGARVERLDNVAALVKALRTHAFTMLAMPRVEQLKLIKSTNGRSLAKEAGVRERSVGQLIDLKWRKKRKGAETLLQLLYIICTDENAFRFFEAAAKSSRTIWEKKPDEELYALIKGAFRSVRR